MIFQSADEAFIPCPFIQNDKFTANFIQAFFCLQGLFTGNAKIIFQTGNFFIQVLIIFICRKGKTVNRKMVFRKHIQKRIAVGTIPFYNADN